MVLWSNGYKAGEKMLRERNANYLDIVASVLLKIMLIVALFFPISTTMEGSKHPQYFQEFLLVNAVAVIFMIAYIISIGMYKRWNT